MKKYIAVLIAALTLSAVNAASFNLVLDTWRNDASLFGGGAHLSYDGGLSWKSTGAGQFRATFDGPSYNNYPNSWITYCTDVQWTLQGGLFEPTPWAEASSLNWNGNKALASSVYLTFRDTISSNEQAVGLQLAIWDALYDGGDGLSSGQFQTKTGTGNALVIADMYLNSPLVSPELGTWWKPVTAAGDHRKNQGLMGNTVSVPEPGSSLVALIVGLGFLGIMRRRMA